jgi:adenine-specific DNA-methyltransferase
MAKSKSQRGRAARPGAQHVRLSWPGKEPLGDEILASPDDIAVVERVEPDWLEDGRGQGALLLSPPAESWRNLLIGGDNLLAMHALMPRLEGRLQLVYIDPPFATGLSYYTLTGVGDTTVERRAYRDQQTGGFVGYLAQMRERLVVMHRLLRDEGHMFLHCDWRANSALRLLLDEVFGPESFRNEIIWRRAPNLGRQAASQQLGRVIDSILVYSKTPGAAFPGPVPRRRSVVALDRKGKPKGARWDDEREAYFTTAPRGDYTDKSIAALAAKGRVYESATGKFYIKYFLTKGDDGRWYKEQPVDTLWDDFEVRPLRHRPKAEDMGYDTQKPEGLLERIVGWATAPGDLVADFYGGSGTTATVAERLGRRWISCDVGQASLAIHRRRLLEIRGESGQRAQPFDVCSIRDHARRRWAEALAAPSDGEADAAQVITLFGGQPGDGRWGEHDGGPVVVAPLAGRTADGWVEGVAAEARERGHSQLTVLAWSWAPSDGAALRARVRDATEVVLTMRTIPDEVVHGRPKPGKVRFAERPEIDLELIPRQDARQLSVRLVELRCSSRLPADQAPDWRELVEAWAVDWRGAKDFEPTWRAYRTRRDRTIALETPAHDFSAREETPVLVRVVTVFGDEIERRLRVRCG